jgi:hypothetical protein
LSRSGGIINVKVNNNYYFKKFINEVMN